MISTHNNATHHTPHTTNEGLLFMKKLTATPFYELDYSALERLATEYYGKHYDIADMFMDGSPNDVSYTYTFYDEVDKWDDEQLAKWLADTATREYAPGWQYTVKRLIQDKILPEGKYILHVSW
jgi:hypothetical protein